MNINPILRTSLFYTIAIVLAEIFHIGQVVLVVFLAPAMIGGQHFNVRVITIFVTRLLISISLGMFVAEMFYNNQFFALVLSCVFLWMLLSYVKSPSKIVSFSSPIFLYCYGFINVTNGMVIENSLMVVCQATTFMLPLSWLCFQLFPTPKKDQCHVAKSNDTVEMSDITELHKIFIILIVAASLMTFLTINVQSAIFCLSVVINAVLRSTIKQGRVVVRSILPVQITGCLIAMVFHMLLLGHPNNIALFSALLLITTSTLFYYSYNKELRHKDIPNFEISFLSATLIPLTLYTNSNGFNVEPFVQRAFDMGFIWVVLSLLVVVIVWLVQKRNQLLCRL
ncbi:hypothetical protein BCU70_09900 [Vibrio sp. 10N.286.49.C2]|uniref:hypothetical protein n=1 Tax=unclassified Vibrio TaxID=2614977 RepID=UPI000C81A3A5|nr:MULTISPECIES: hypothetical protein [unclassified Vibrio]PMH26452.1 hypothetical protein BCU70_09900 [Vibrio sp. 10N.286.49.C2]PMH54824.1 hypothetical protein BCU66_11035 [Vibrio sp. 10N.286.49.B1]PMH82080.1 hypothetical protein BCU58_19270 [Vibrio sp. 10N.286.48.B7]